MNFVTLSSSRGTVFEAVMKSIKDGSLTSTCLGLVADRADRGCVIVAKKYNVPFKVVQHLPEEDREAYDMRLHDAIMALAKNDSNIVIGCMGWMRILSPWFVSKHVGKIINVHPSLLPKHPGAHAHDLVLAAKDTESGMTIHLIDEGVDTGTILVQKKCSVLPVDTVDTLKTRVQALECEWFPKVLQMIQAGEISL